MELNAWSVRDYFNFVVANAKSPPAMLGSVNTDNDFRFRILLSFAFIDSSRLDTVLSRRSVLVSRGGSVMMNSTFLNLTKLANLSDDQLFVEVERRPKYGHLEFLGAPSDNEDEEETDESVIVDKSSSTRNSLKKQRITADDLCSGRHLLYRHYSGKDENDEFVLGIYALRGERNKRPAKIKVPIQVYIQHEYLEAKVCSFKLTYINVFKEAIF